jgi:PQQ system protein
MRRTAQWMVPLAAAVLSGCSYVGLLRPSVLQQLDPGVVALVNELPNLDHPNKAIVAKIYALGGLAHAQEGADGVLRAHVRAPLNEYIWQPAFIVMPREGELELTFENHDQHFHMALLPSNGDRRLLHLPIGEGGTARIRLDQPGMYWYGCPVANHAGRGMFGFILVYGETPQEARLDRPEQPRPVD